MKNILNQEQIKNIKICGKILAESMREVSSAIKVGIRTKELDQIAENAIKKRGAEPSFLGYEVKGIGEYPASLCISIDSEIVHGVPTHERCIKDGEVVSLDLGAKYKGVCTDMAVTVIVGEQGEKKKKLVEVTKKCLELGIDAARVGNRIGAIGEAVQTFAEENGLGVVRDLVGHGIGEDPHMEPKIPNFGNKNDGPEILEGMALAIEPMITQGSHKIKVHKDNWTILTKDESLAAHFEHTIIIENGKAHIVTKI